MKNAFLKNISFALFQMFHNKKKLQRFGDIRPPLDSITFLLIFIFTLLLSIKTGSNQKEFSIFD